MERNAKKIAARFVAAVHGIVDRGATGCPDCGGEFLDGFTSGAGDLVCGECFKAWGYRAAGLQGFQKGDRVRRKSDGMEGEVFYVGSGPKGDKVSVIWGNPVQRILGPDIVSPGSIERV